MGINYEEQFIGKLSNAHKICVCACEVASQGTQSKYNEHNPCNWGGERVRGCATKRLATSQ